MKNKFLLLCENHCWCEFCNRKVEKGEKFLFLEKSARRGVARINICRECLIQMFVELNAERKEVTKIRKEIILQGLEK